MAKFYFFSDPAQIDTQSSGQEYGPTTQSGGNDRYRITSIHSAQPSNTANVVAICDGTVCVQEVNSTTINLILKPSLQPEFNFVPIKYFIYKGIKKSSLIDASTSEIAISTNNDLTASIWASQNAWNTATGGTDNPSENVLGINYTALAAAPYTLLDTDPIDNLFFQDNVDFQFPNVKGGWEIGEFDGTQFGFEIILESIGFEPTVKLARNLENYVEVTTLPGSPTQAVEFEHWHDKEDVLTYLDPAAFFGCFYHHKLGVNSTGNISEKTGDEIYDEILLIFQNKNKTYLDIRNEHNHSFNYYGNYDVSGNNLSIAYDDVSTLTEIDYYDKANAGWPILIIDNSDFPAGNTMDNNIFRIAMPQGDNTLPLSYLSQGVKNIDYPKEPTGSNKFIEVDITGGNYIDEISIAIPNKSGATNAVASFVQKRYLKQFDNSQPVPTSSGTVIRNAHYLDNMFLFRMTPKIAGTAEVKTKIISSHNYIDAKDNQGADFIASIGVSTDMNGKTFMSFPFQTNKQSGKSKRTVPLVDSLSRGFDELKEHLKSKFANLNFAKFTLNETTPKDIITYTHSVRASEDHTQDSDFSLFNSVHVDNSNLTALDTLALNFHSKLTIYLSFDNITINSDDDLNEYSTATLKLHGFKQVSNSISVHTETTTISVSAVGRINDVIPSLVNLNTDTVISNSNLVVETSKVVVVEGKSLQQTNLKATPLDGTVIMSLINVPFYTGNNVFVFDEYNLGYINEMDPFNKISVLKFNDFIGDKRNKGIKYFESVIDSKISEVLLHSARYPLAMWDFLSRADKKIEVNIDGITYPQIITYKGQSTSIDDYGPEFYKMVSRSHITTNKHVTGLKLKDQYIFLSKLCFDIDIDNNKYDNFVIDGGGSGLVSITSAVFDKMDPRKLRIGPIVKNLGGGNEGVGFKLNIPKPSPEYFNPYDLVNILAHEKKHLIDQLVAMSKGKFYDVDKIEYRTITFDNPEMQQYYIKTFLEHRAWTFQKGHSSYNNLISTKLIDDLNGPKPNNLKNSYDANTDYNIRIFEITGLIE